MTMLPVVVPSWVIPGSPVVNAAWLRGRTRDRPRGIMLCCFESAPRLPMELPPACPGLRWHVHLPTDLPWERGGAAAGAAACRVMAEAAHLLDAASLIVLHRPPRPPLLAGFLDVWRKAGHDSRALLLENLPGDTMAKDKADPSGGSGPRLCLDVAHLALSLPPDRAAERVEALAAREPGVCMIHWSAPRSGRAARAALMDQDAHLSLTTLDAAGKKLYRHVAACIPHAVDVIEVFDWDGILASWELLREWRGTAGGKPCLDCRTGS